MQFSWFKRSGILLVPASIMGWLIAFAAVVYAVYTFIDTGDSRSHSASDTLMNFAFRLVLIAIGYSIIGWITSGRKTGGIYPSRLL